MIVAPSILSADFSSLLDEIMDVYKCGVNYLHIDVMDGHFVPNITIGPVVIKSLRNKVDMIFDVHLMITDPKKYIEDFVKAGADIITFHYETVSNPKELIEYIKSFGVKAGVSIKPNTNIKVLDEYLDKLDLVLVMSVEPGFGGQKFIDSALEKLSYLSEMKKRNGYRYLIEVDGGINNETSIKCKECGCEILVAGSYIFGSDNRKTVIEKLLNL